MNADDIRQVVQAVLSEENTRHAQTIDDVVLKAIATILTSFGIEDEDRIELREDFRYLRRFRKSAEQVKRMTARVVITAIISGIIGAAWLGLKDMVRWH